MNNNPWSQLNTNPEGPTVSVSPQKRSMTTKVFSVVGGAVLLVLAGFGLIKAMPGLGSGLAAVVTSVFSSGNKITVNGPSTVNSGQPFTLTWEEQTKPGSYTLTYDCQNNTYLRLSNGTVLYCNTETPIDTTNNSVTATLWSNQPENVNVYVRFKENGSNSASTGVKTISINQSSTQDTAIVSNTSSQSTSTTPVNIAPTPGIADLQVRILSVGKVDRNTNVFTPTTAVLPTDRAAVHFEIINAGTAPSGPWKFSAILPTNPAHTQISDTQLSLFPGDRIEYTLGFDSIIDQPVDTIGIFADPFQQVSENNRNNNYTEATINVIQ